MEDQEQYQQLENPHMEDPIQVRTLENQEQRHERFENAEQTVENVSPDVTNQIENEK
ncbi:hypothetical protein L195_g060671, partial [Trifolium pratense]